MSKTAKKAAETIISAPIEIELGGDKYQVARPTLRTIIEVSALMNEMPEIKINDKTTILNMLAQAKDTRNLAKIIALLIVGSGSGIIYQFKKKRVLKRVFSVYTPQELSSVLAKLLATLQINDFFVLTTSLSALNITKEVVEN